MSAVVHEFDLRYDGTVLGIHVYVRANQDIGKLQKSVARAAAGPRIDAFAMWTELYPPGRALGWEGDGFGEHKVQVEAFLRQSQGDVVALHLYVNTDSDPKKLSENIQRAARGPRLDALMCAIERYDGEDGRKVWCVMQDMLRRVAADSGAKPFSFREDIK